MKHNMDFRKELTHQIKEHKATFIVYTVLRSVVLLATILAAIRKDYESVFFCGLSLILFIIPFFIQQNFGIELPSTLEIIILLFIFCAEILGELRCYYIRFPGWDTMLHTINGFLCAAIGYGLVDILNKNRRFRFDLSPLYLAVTAFCFSMTIGVLWEFFEFGSDMIFHTDMQKDTVINSIISVNLDPEQTNTPITIDGIKQVIVNQKELGVGGYLDIGLFDTMKDLFVNFIGAIVFSIFGFFSSNSKKKKHFVDQFIPTLTDQTPKL